MKSFDQRHLSSQDNDIHMRIVGDAWLPGEGGGDQAHCQGRLVSTYLVYCYKTCRLWWIVTKHVVFSGMLQNMSPLVNCYQTFCL